MLEFQIRNIFIWNK